MTFRMALRSFTAQPVRSLVLACGFGIGIACMAGLLGVGEVILEQSRSPQLRGGGDLVIYGGGGKVPSARFITSQLLASPPLTGRTAVASPSLDATLYLVQPERRPLPLRARGGVPTLERALEDFETAGVATWVDTPADRAWASPDPGDVLRAMDRFHPVPDVPARVDSWAEWLYFNGRRGDVRFYLSFVVGPPASPGIRRAGVRLQLVREGSVASYVDRGEISEEALLGGAPDIRIGASGVRLEGQRYRIEVALKAEDRKGRTGPFDLVGEITVDAVPGRSLPPFQIGGAGGWVSGYVVPVISGPLGGWLRVDGELIPLADGVGYHDHNWGFWEGVTWQWGQVASEELSLVFGRVRPPADAADPGRIPGFLVALDADGPLGFATDVTIEELDEPASGRLERIVVDGEGEAIRMRLDLEILSSTSTRFGASVGGPRELVQMQARYRVTGSIGHRQVEFTAPGAAETFRGSTALAEGGAGRAPGRDPG
jgi:hypothetical protein